jgi:hypothetical protein
MNTHPNADDLYRMWAESYPKDGYFPYSRPSDKTDQVIIVEQCKFKTPQAVWDAAAKHKDSKSLLKKWADSYYRPGSSTASTPAQTPAPAPKTTPTPAPAPAPAPAAPKTTPTPTPAPAPSTANYQKTIQDKVKFQNPSDVWKAVDKSSNKDLVYKTWAESYKKGKAPANQQSKPDKEVILYMCPELKNISANLWKTLEANFANYNALYKGWANTYRDTPR